MGDMQDRRHLTRYAPSLKMQGGIVVNGGQVVFPMVLRLAIPTHIPHPMVKL